MLFRSIKTDPDALNIIAQKADGGMRDALSIFDQTASYTQGNITYEAVIENLNVLDYEYYFRLTDAIIDGNVIECLLVLNDILNRGFEGQYIISGIASHFRDLLVCKDPATAGLFQVGASIRERYIETAKRCSNDFLYKAIELANDCDLNYRQSKNRRLLLELTLIKLCQLSDKPKGATEKEESFIKPIEVEKKSVSRGKPGSDKKDPLKEESSDIKRKSPSQMGMGISLSSLRDKNDEVTEEIKKEIKKNGNNSFTENDLISAWREFAESLDEEKLLKNAMNLYHPKMIGETIFVVEVNTDINKGFLTNNSEMILSFLRKKLKNDDLTMTISISEGNAIKKPLTSHEVFDDLVKKNPSLQKLSDSFGLELS